jgi:DNA-binding NarL/FixJ family response regulator
MNMTNDINMENSEKTQETVKILVVDDHAIVRKGLALLINQDSSLKVSAEAENADQALGILENQQIDLAIIDISLNGTNGIQLTEKIKSKYPNLPILILTMHDEAIYAKLAFRAGAEGYVTKHEAAESIVSAIHMMLKKKPYISQTIAQQMPESNSFNL